MGDVEFLKEHLVPYPDFPKKGSVFIDLFPILRNPLAFETLITNILHHLTSNTILQSPSKTIDVVVGLDARGFLYGPIIALRLGAAFVPIRKKGKLPGKCLGVTYELKYGTDSFELQMDAIMPGQSVIIVDDVIATGGTAAAAGELITKMGGKTLEYLFVLEFTSLKGREKLNAPTYSTIQLE